MPLHVGQSHGGRRQRHYSCPDNGQHQCTSMHGRVLDSDTTNKTSVWIGFNTVKRIINCTTCGKKFTTLGNLKRHRLSFHAATVTRYQCWHCLNTYARKETARNHAFKVHGDSDRKTVTITTHNKKYKFEIFKPEAWTPPPEAKPKATIYQLKIGEKSHINTLKQKRRISEWFHILHWQ